MAGNRRALPLVLDSFERVALRPVSGSYNHQSKTWMGESTAIPDIVATRQTHQKGEDH